MTETKYCPNCLAVCSKSPLGGFACIPCEILQYSTAILLDSPDLEKQKDYKLRMLIGMIAHPNIQEDGIDNIITDIKQILTPPPQ